MNSAHALIEKLVDKNLTIGAVESFTGGLFGKTLTDVPGSSKAFKGSLVTYSDESKVNILGIPEEFIKEKKTPEEYAQDLSENEKWKEFHLKIASNGSSQIPEKMEDVKHHYVSFVINKGNLYELDGRLNMPYKVNENVKQEELLDKVIDVVKGRLQRKEMNNLFSIMFIEKN